MNKKNREIEGVEETVPELSPKEKLRKERREGAEKRRKAKQKDKVARFAGAILLGMLLLLGFLLWVAGEMKTDTGPIQIRSVPIPSSNSAIRVR